MMLFRATFLCEYSVLTFVCNMGSCIVCALGTGNKDSHMQQDTYFSEPQLLTLPVSRPAYSDRTAWMMAELSRLAYVRFEVPKKLPDLAKQILAATNESEVAEQLKEIISQSRDAEGDPDALLTGPLAKAGLTLVKAISVADSQCFVAKRDTNGDQNDPGMLVVAFRGSEKHWGDIKTDLQGNLTKRDGYAVHTGFDRAYELLHKPLQEIIEQHPGLPLYFTGHSLGAALAVMAAKHLGSLSAGACYTFGGPRVGNLAFIEGVKIPIYRIVNAADGVPQLPPPKWTIDLLLATISLLPLRWMQKLRAWLSNFQGYSHYGDQRYLTSVETIDCPKAMTALELIANPPLPYRLERMVERLKRYGPTMLLKDHSIKNYCVKLRTIALQANQHLMVETVSESRIVEKTPAANARVTEREVVSEV
jgi:hypothetical protein